MPDGTVGEGAEETPTASRNPLSEYGTVYLKGMAMGAADTVPGVSGGTIALITGIYERLITALAALDPRLLRQVLGVHEARGRARLWRTLWRVDLPFLVVLGLGAVTSVVALSRFMHAAIVTYPAITYAFFFGLIAASAVVLLGELSFEGAPTVVGALAGFVVGFLVAAEPTADAVIPGLPVVFVTGAITITALILPGVSGAFILLLLGQYEYLTGVLEAFVDDVIAVLVGGNAAGLVDGATVVATFGGGAVVGLLSVAHAIRWALDRQRAATLAFLVSLMVGSLRMPLVEVAGSVASWTPATVTLVAGPALVGGLAVLGLDRYTDDLDLAAPG